MNLEILVEDLLLGSINTKLFVGFKETVSEDVNWIYLVKDTV